MERDARTQWAPLLARPARAVAGARHDARHDARLDARLDARHDAPLSPAVGTACARAVFLRS
jgi:hypothetical protein